MVHLIMIYLSTQIVTYYSIKDNKIFKIYYGKLDNNYEPHDDIGKFIIYHNQCKIEVIGKCEKGKLISYFSYKSKSEYNDIDITNFDWNQKKDGWILYLKYKNSNQNHVIERTNDDISIVYCVGDTFIGSIIESNETNNFAPCQNLKASGKYTFNDNSFFVGIIQYSNETIKLMNGVLETFDENKRKCSMKIVDNMYYSGEICNNIDFKSICYGQFPFMVCVKSKRCKLNYLKVENKIIICVDIEFVDKYCYNCESGIFDPIDGEQIMQFRGEIKNKNLNGNGILHFANGKTYTGMFSDSIFVHGTIIYSNGKKHSGNFLNGKNPHGIIHVEKNGESYCEYYAFGVKTYFKFLSKKIIDIFTTNKIVDNNDDNGAEEMEHLVPSHATKLKKQ